MQPTARSLLGGAFHDLRRTYTHMVLTDLLARVLGVALIAPLVGLLLRVFLSAQAGGVVSDTAIVAFFLHPLGILALLVVGGASLAVLFAETSQLMVIGFGALEDRRVTWLDALLYAARRAWACLRLAWLGLGKLLLIAAPFLLAVGGIYLLVASKHDINHYLANMPPAFVAGLWGAGLLLAVLTVLVIQRIARWLIALPMVLFENTNPREALHRSWELTAPHRVRLTLWLLGWVLAVIVLGAIVTFLVSALGNLLVPYGSDRIHLTLLMLTLVLLVSFVANVMVSIFAAVLFPLLVVRLYRALAGPGALTPEIAPRGSLGARASHRMPAKRLVALGVAVLILISIGGYFVLRGVDWDDDAIIIAHRGGAAVAPENTTAAFERGITDGADWLELDVQENAEGEIVVIHDRDFMRVAKSPLMVHEATSGELATIDIGSHFAPEFAAQRTPLLKDVLEAAKGKAGVVIELKYYGYEKELEKRVVEIVDETGSQDDIIVMSMNYEGIRTMAALRPDWTYGFLNAVTIGDLTKLEVDFLAITAGAATRRMIQRAHARGLKVYVWTVDDPIQMTMMMSRGVDGIITDEVTRTHDVREWRTSLTPIGRVVVWLAAEAGMLGDVDFSSDRDDA